MLAGADLGWLVERPIAHRGLHRLAHGIPENSMPAFEAAIAAGMPIELDVQRLGDGTPVVFHDADLLRAAGVGRPLSIEDRRSIERYRVFGTSHGIPRLEHVLTLVAGRVPILVEIKNPSSHPGVAAAVYAVLRGYAGPYAVQSFDPYTLWWFRTHADQVPRGQLAGPLRDDRISPLKRVASRTLAVSLISRPHFINYDLRGLPDGWVRLVTRWLGVPLLCWTVSSRADQRKAQALGINYVFDEPDQP